MMRYIRYSPLHAFLIGLYIISFIYVRNINDVSLAMTWKSALITVSVSALVFGICYLLSRSLRKAGILTTFCIIGFFVYGFIYEYLDMLFYKGYWPFAHIHRFLCFFYLVVYSALLVIFLRSKRPHYTVNYILNVFVLSLLCFNIVLGFFMSRQRSRANAISNPFLQAAGDIQPAAPPAGAPDVYYIILDGFASERTLLQHYGAQYKILYDYLRGKGFYIADSSRSNYPVTKFSLSSSLNMHYLQQQDPAVTTNMVKQNLVSWLFHQNGYRVVNMQSGYAVTQKLEYANKAIHVRGLNEFERRLLELTILRLDDVFGIENYLRVRSQMDKLQELAKEAGPKFGFVHIVSPHPPFVFDEHGNQKRINSLSDRNWEPKEEYAIQLKYISKEVIRFLDTLLAQSKTPPVIILQSDHGPLLSHSDPQVVYDARMSILNAYYVPDTIRKQLYPGISPVNTFRLVTSGLLGRNYPVLPDTCLQLDAFSVEPTFKMYIRK